MKSDSFFQRLFTKGGKQLPYLLLLLFFAQPHHISMKQALSPWSTFNPNPHLQKIEADSFRSLAKGIIAADFFRPEGIEFKQESFAKTYAALLKEYGFPIDQIQQRLFREKELATEEQFTPTLREKTPKGFYNTLKKILSPETESRSAQRTASSLMPQINKMQSQFHRTKTYSLIDRVQRLINDEHQYGETFLTLEQYNPQRIINLVKYLDKNSIDIKFYEDGALYIDKAYFSKSEKQKILLYLGSFLPLNQMNGILRNRLISVEDKTSLLFGYTLGHSPEKSIQLIAQNPEILNWLSPKLILFDETVLSVDADLMLTAFQSFMDVIEKSAQAGLITKETLTEYEQKMKHYPVLGRPYSWSHIQEALELIATHKSNLNTLRPLIEFIVFHLHGGPLFSSDVSTDSNNRADIQEVLNSLFLSDQVFEVYPDLRRLVKVMPSTLNLLQEMRDYAESVADAAVNNSRSREGIVGSIVYFIHESPSSDDLIVAQVFLEYLNEEDPDKRQFKVDTLTTHSSEKVRSLAHLILGKTPETGRLIEDDKKRGTYENLSNSGRLEKTKARLQELIQRLDSIYGRESLSQIIKAYHSMAKKLPSDPLLHQRMESILNQLGSYDPISKKAENLIQIEQLSSSDLIQLLDQLILSKESIEENIRTSPKSRLNLILLDSSLDVLFFKIATQLSSNFQELPTPFLENLLIKAGQLVKKQLNKEENIEFDYISKELFSVSLEKNPKRFYAIIGRLTRLIQNVSNQTVEAYQSHLDAFETLVGNPVPQKRDFSADLLREEAVYQFSLLLHEIEDRVAKKMDLTWKVTRPGKKEGQLIYVKNPALLNQIITGLSEPTILVVESIPDDTLFNEFVAAIISREEKGLLSHIAIRSDETNTVLARPIGSAYNQVKKLAKEQPWVLLETSSEKMIQSIPKPKKKSTLQKQAPLVRVQPIKANLKEKTPLLDITDYRQETVGRKAFMLNRLGMASVPKSRSIPFGYFHQLLLKNGSIGQKILKLRSELAREKDPKRIQNMLSQLQSLILELEISDPIPQQVFNGLGPGPYMVRSSTNAEDLEGYRGAGVYESFAQVWPNDLITNIKKVYQSLYTLSAFEERRKVGMNEEEIYPAVLIQRMVVSEYSFVIHTQDPTSDPETILIEAFPGLGESVVAGEGSPHRFRYNKKTGLLERIAYANKSFKIEAHQYGGTQNIPMDYSTDILTQEIPEWLYLLGKLAIQVEREFDQPQDIEGAIERTDKGLEIRLVQSRNQVRPSNTGALKAALETKIASFPSLSNALQVSL